MAQRRKLLTHAQWEKIAPSLAEPPKSRRGGRPWCENREVLEGVLWVLKSGARYEKYVETYDAFLHVACMMITLSRLRNRF